MKQLAENRRPLHLPSLDEARQILDGRLPPILEQTTFRADGLVDSPQGLKVPVYLANGLGFNEPGRYYIEKVIKPKMEAAGALILDPFQECGALLDPQVFDQKQSVEAQVAAWQKFNRKTIGTVNYDLLIPRAKVMLAIMEGYPVDEGAAAEVAYMATNFGPVIGVRSDLRLAENPATGTNPAVTFFMGGPRYGGGYFEGPGAYDQGFGMLQQLNQEIVSSANK